MSIRIYTRIIIKIWEQKISEKSGNKLPIIIPLVVYHGDSKWNIGTNLWHMMEDMQTIPAAIKKHIPNYEYIIYDLSPYGDEEIKGNAKLTIYLNIIRAIFSKDDTKFKQTIINAITALDQLDSQEKGIEYFETVVRYIMSARDELEIKDLYDTVKLISLERSQDIMTIAERLHKEGMLAGKRKTAINLLRMGISEEQVAKAAELEIKDVIELKRELSKE